MNRPIVRPKKSNNGAVHNYFYRRELSIEVYLNYFNCFKISKV